MRGYQRVADQQRRAAETIATRRRDLPGSRVARAAVEFEATHFISRELPLFWAKANFGARLDPDSTPSRAEFPVAQAGAEACSSSDHFSALAPASACTRSSSAASSLAPPW